MILSFQFKSLLIITAPKQTPVLTEAEHTVESGILLPLMGFAVITFVGICATPKKIHNKNVSTKKKIIIKTCLKRAHFQTTLSGLSGSSASYQKIAGLHHLLLLRNQRALRVTVAGHMMATTERGTCAILVNGAPVAGDGSAPPISQMQYAGNHATQFFGYALTFSKTWTQIGTEAVFVLGEGAHEIDVGIAAQGGGECNYNGVWMRIEILPVGTVVEGAPVLKGAPLPVVLD